MSSINIVGKIVVLLSENFIPRENFHLLIGSDRGDSTVFLFKLHLRLSDVRLFATIFVLTLIFSRSTNFQ